MFESLVEFGRNQPAIDAILLVGSYATGRQTPQSDIDLMIISDAKDALVEESGWVESFGVYRSLAKEAWGSVTSLRVFYQEFEIEFSLGTRSWLQLPLDPGTMHVLQGGYRVLFERGDLLPKIREFLPEAAE